MLNAQCHVCGHLHPLTSDPATKRLTLTKSECDACGAKLMKGGKINFVDTSPPTPPPTTSTKDVTEDEEEDDDDCEEMPPPPPKEQVPDDFTDDTFQRQVMSVLKDNMYKRTVPKRKRGKLDDKRLWRAKANYKNVFKQTTEKKNKNYKFSLLIDISGSMGQGDKAKNAYESAVLMAQNLEAMEVPYSVAFFHNDYVPVKAFSDKTYKDTILDKGARYMMDGPHRYHPREGDLWENCDLLALKMAYDDIHRHKNKNEQNVLIVFSDGDPTGCYLPKDSLAPRTREYLTRTSQDIETIDRNNYSTYLTAEVAAHRDVLTVGVGLESHAVEHIYPNLILVDDAKDLKPKFVDLMRRVITR